MRVLLDTQVWLWMNSAPRRLSRTALAVITNPENDRLLSVASCWEIATKYALQKLPLNEEPGLFLRRRLPATATDLLPIGLADVLATGNLPWLHRDPFDRLIVAQAILQEIPILTADRQIGRYDVPTISAI